MYIYLYIYINFFILLYLFMLYIDIDIDIIMNGKVILGLKKIIFKYYKYMIIN